MQFYFMNSVPAGIAAPSVIESTLSEAKPRLIKDDISLSQWALVSHPHSGPP